MRWLGKIVLCVMVFGFATPAAAQDTPKAEISGGYNWFTAKASGDEDETWEKFPKGWYVDVAGNVTDTVSVVGQVTGNYKTFEEVDGDFDLNIHSFMFGVRGSSPGRVRGFGQVLVGGARLNGSQGSFSTSSTHLAWQFGGGVTVMGSGNVGFRAGVDYIRLNENDDSIVLDSSANGFRFGVGVVFGIGSR
jgi:hypothetical protein